MISEIRAELIFENFLSLKNSKEFEKYKNSFKNIETTPIKKISNLTGEVKIAIDKKINNDLFKYQHYFKAMQPEVRQYHFVLFRIYKKFKAVATNLESART